MTITFIGWSATTLHELSEDQNLIDQFTRETGIHVNFIPGPQSVADRLMLYKQFISQKSASPDVYYIDVVWPKVMADDVLDLNPYFKNDAASFPPFSIQDEIVNGRLVGLPFDMQFGVLYYRADLLQKYRYSAPPATWDDLEKMATRIQKGERASGRNDFWGFVWTGAAFEGLTSAALEWQASNGGGNIIENDGTISVNNPQAIEAMQRAHNWIGTISPPAVMAFKDDDVRNFWDEGNAAFIRSWVWRQFSQGLHEASDGNEIGISPLPAGPDGAASVLGGHALAISKYSAHPQEAIALLRFLTRHDTQQTLWNNTGMLPSRREFYEKPVYLENRPTIQKAVEDVRSSMVVRPSTVTGAKYDKVSQAYFQTVHSILAGEATPEDAMAELEKKLVSITGFKPGPPLPRQEHP